MPFDLSNSEPIDPETEEARAWLATLQGNILKGHGRERAVYVFFALPQDRASAAAILRRLARRFVTSALVQQQQTAQYRRLGVSGGLFGNLFLSASGYCSLGRNPKALFPEPVPETGPPFAASTFASGMRATAQEDFADPPVTEWEPGYQARIDAMLLLADDDESCLMRGARKALEMLERAGCTVSLVETGQALRDANGNGIEHFGFADGRSQPVYLREDFAVNADNGRIRDGRGESLRRWDPFEPLGRVLRRDPEVPDNPLCHGSFLVFRKLEQNVRAFHEQRRALARLLGLDEAEEARAGAMMVGRFEDGTPLTLQRWDGWHPAETNDFNFDSDVRGARCPLFSHIRKVNPRGHTNADTRVAPGSRTAPAREAQRDDHERCRRITRRSITYDNRDRHPVPAEERDKPPAAHVGVLFMCFQASIREQFAFMQRHWCNNADFPQGSTGADALVGQGSPQPLAWPTVYNDDGRRIAAPLEKMITMKGGEFFFAPSLPFFTTLVAT
jgi:Dyp-type peroxidase family